MDFNGQNMRTAGVSSQHEPTLASSPVASVTGSKNHQKRDRRLFKNPIGWGLGLIAVILIVFGLLWLFNAKGYNETGEVNKSEFQAVFLSNGQVYFGHLDSINSQYAKLTNIYYLQTSQPVQPKDGQTSTTDNNTQLIKLGNEIHGPEDLMVINSDQILFWENLKPSGKVSEAIKNYQSSGDKNSSVTTPTSQSSTAGQSSSSNSSASTSTTPAPTLNSGSSSTTSSTNSKASEPAKP